MTNPGSTFLVYLRHLSTERWFDWLDIGEGDDIGDEAARVHHLSGRVRPWWYWSSESDKLWITFYTDSSVRYRGFVLEIEEIVADEPPTEKLPSEPIPEDPVTDCGGNITITSGGQVPITSPNYPDDYINNLYCVWLVETDSQLRINIDFVDLETERYIDWVEIGNGHNQEDLTTSALRVSGSGKDVPDNHESTSCWIWITFTSDPSVVFSGFRLLLTEIQEPVDCGEDYELEAVIGSSVFIVSPNYPDNYNNNDLCKWTVRVSQALRSTASGYSLYIAVDSFDTEANYDWLEIGPGRSASDGSLSYRFSGSDVSDTFAGDTDQLWVQWTSDKTNTRAGFNITFYAGVPCGGSLTGPSGNISSP